MLEILLLVLIAVGITSIISFVYHFTFVLYTLLKIKYKRWKADQEYVKAADAKILGGEFKEIEKSCDKDMIRILKLMNRKERREFLKSNSRQLKNIRNG